MAHFQYPPKWIQCYLVADNYGCTGAASAKVVCTHSRPKTIHILQCHFIRSHIRRVQVCVAAVTCHLQLDRMIVCLINLTSRPYVTQSLRHVHVSHHHYVTLTSRSCISSSLRYVHVSHHPYVTFMCPIILTSRSCVPSS